MIFSRTALLLGEENLEKLKNSHVIVFGVGGVGGYVCEALARSGVGALDIVDNDVISPSNINRQIIALRSTIGRKKTEVLAERLKDINPDIQVTQYNLFFLPENADCIDFSKYDYVVDAIDTVSGKIAIIEKAKESCIKVNKELGVFVGRVLSGDQFIASEEKKQWLIKQFSGFCVEMEGAAIAHAATVNKVPFVIIRCLSDCADDSATSTYQFNEEVCAKMSASLVSEFVKNI